MKKNYFLKTTLMAILMFAALFAQAQSGSISGTVYDEDKNPVPGASVTLEGTTRTTVTGNDGKFSITNLAAGAYRVTVKYIGLATKTQSITIGSSASTLDFNLISDAANIEEIVAIGYGTQKKSVVTGSISKINASDLENKPVLNLTQAIQGRATGVTATTNSGQPGDGPSIMLRGRTSTNGSGPLYVVDGMVIGGGLDYLNPQDIASVEILKDAASAAIYGTQAANGVIIVTTKRGTLSDGLRINYNGYVSTQAAARKLDLLNATQYATLYNEAQLAANANATVRFPNPSQYGVGTDWQSFVFNDNAMATNHDLSFSGGTQKSTYFASFGYIDQEGIVASQDSRYKRFTARFNSEHKMLNDKLTFGNTIGYTRTNSVGVGTNSEYGSPLSRAINIDPITPAIETDPAKYGASPYINNPVVRTPEGFPYGISQYAQSEVLNPVAALEVQQGNGWSDKFVGNAFLELEVIKGLKLRSSGGFDLAFWGGQGFTPIHFLNSINQATITTYNRDINRGLYYVLDNTVSYSRKIQKHNFSVLAGYSAQKNRGETQGGLKENIPATNLAEASLAFSVPRLGDAYWGGEYLVTLNSVLGRLTYDFDEKYLLTGIYRRDGSSRFGPDRKYGNFSSGSIGWNVHKESFFPQNKYLTTLKIRGGYGVNGNDNIGDFNYISTVSGGRNYSLGTGQTLQNGVSPNAIANPEYRWEETAQLNIGFDATLFNGKMSLTADWFDKQTSGILARLDVPGYVGNQGPIANIGDMSNKGFEFDLGYGERFGDFNFRVTGIASFVKNNTDFIADSRTFINLQGVTPQNLTVTRAEVGSPYGSFYGFESDGLFQNAAEVANYKNAGGTPIQPNAKPGDIRFRDRNGDGAITDDDRTILGSSIPDFTYGLTFSADYKGFDFYVLGTGVAGNQIFNALRRFDLPTSNYTTAILDRWTGEGTSNTMPRLTLDDTNANYSRVSSLFLESGAYFRIKTVSLGYSLPTSFVKKAKLNKVRVYVMANNLFTFTKYTGYDPEIGGGSFGVDRGYYPQARAFFAGLNVGF